MTFTRLAFAASVSLLMACGSPALEDVSSAEAESSAKAEVELKFSCHNHRIDWSETWFSTDGACTHSKKLDRGTIFCMRDGNDYVRCGDGELWTFGYAEGEYGWVKLRALDGHD